MIHANSTDQRLILVTGASGLIGGALAEAISQMYPKNLVILTGRSMERLNEVRQNCHDNTECISCDLSEPRNVADMMNVIEERYGRRPTVLVHCAGNALKAKVVEASIYEISNTLNTNISSTIMLLNQTIPHMLKENFGSVWVITSGHAKYGLPSYSIYSAAKSGLERIIESVKEECRGSKIYFGVISPGKIVPTINSHNCPLKFKDQLKSLLDASNSPDLIASKVVPNLFQAKDIKVGFTESITRFFGAFFPRLLLYLHRKMRDNS